MGIEYLNKEVSYRSLLVLIFCFINNHIYSQSHTPGISSFDSTGYVEYISGNLPVIISVPHGGYLKPASIANRDCDDCVYGRDSYTQELARSISDAFFEQMGGHAHIVINLLHRKKFDANRDIEDAADGNPTVEQVWANYHQFIDSAKDNIVQNYGRGLFIDLHGHGHDIQRLELGYLLSRSELELPDSELNSITYIEQSSIQTLVVDNLQLLTHSELLRGNNSLGSLISNKGIPAVPSKPDPFPFSGQAYFSGGYNTVRHGSRNEGNIDGIQIECHRSIRVDRNLREALAQDLTKSINQFIDIHYDDQYIINNDNPITSISEEYLNEVIEVFPNPVTNDINIKSDLDMVKISVYNYLGMKVCSRIWNGYPVDISFLSSGYYILKLKRDDGLPLGAQILIKN